MTAKLADEVHRCSSVTLTNGDRARLAGFVIFQKQARNPTTILGRIEEIIQEETGSIHILLVEWDILPLVMPYRMPAISPSRRHVVVGTQVRSF